MYMLILEGAMDSSSSFLIASQQNHVLAFICLLCLLLNGDSGTALDMNTDHELTAHVANMDAQSLSLPFWNLFAKIGLRSAPSSNMPDKLKHTTSYQSSSSERKHVSIKSLQEIHVRSAMFWGTGSIGKALPANVKLLGPSCKVDGHDIQTQPFPTVFYSHLLTKGHSKGTRARQKTFKVLSLIPLYQFKEDY